MGLAGDGAERFEGLLSGLVRGLGGVAMLWACALGVWSRFKWVTAGLGQVVGFGPTRCGAVGSCGPTRCEAGWSCGPARCEVGWSCG
jgi:hypothetical protein